MRAAEYWRAGSASWLLAALFVAPTLEVAALPGASADSAPTNRPPKSVKIAPKEPAPATETFAIPAAPRPTLARRADLPLAFTWKAPNSLTDLRSMERT